MVKTIWFQFDLIKFRKDLSVYTQRLWTRLWHPKMYGQSFLAVAIATLICWRRSFISGTFIYVLLIRVQCKYSVCRNKYYVRNSSNQTFVAPISPEDVWAIIFSIWNCQFDMLTTDFYIRNIHLRVAYQNSMWIFSLPRYIFMLEIHPTKVYNVNIHLRVTLSEFDKNVCQSLLA